MTFATSPSAARRLLWCALVPALVAVPGRALATDADESLFDPRVELNPAGEFDPRVELDPRVDPADPPAPGAPPPSASPPGGPRRAPMTISVGASYQQLVGGEPSYGALLLLSVPLERFGTPSLRASAIGDETRPPPPPPPPPGAYPPGAGPPPTPPPPLPPLRVPVVVTPDVARSAVDAALRRAHLIDPGARMDALAERARRAAALPELRLRVMRTVDVGQALSPTEYDPTRTTAVDDVLFWLEARATWRLDRLVFAEEEVALERMRHERAEAQAKLTTRVLKLLFEWQRALAFAENLSQPPEEILGARLKVLEAEAELDLLTGGWFARWAQKAAPRPPGEDGGSRPRTPGDSGAEPGAAPSGGATVTGDGP